eukprot:TRINITY_DN8021_c0_g1_i2.p1 TRINITY_DN8021_c0_g1~~TRINITY_DN8021_c0_g1_i2.p1  ORF type:complete len:141 (+),score=29.47 TRINITY_DN8021_c0_g1_i2:100-522(+)
MEVIQEYFSGMEGNGALRIGSFTLLFFSSVFFITSYLLDDRKKRTKSIGYSYAYMCAATSIVEFTMSMGFGYLFNGNHRKQFILRYINWGLNQPLVVWEAGFLSQAPFSSQFFAVITALLTVLSTSLAAFCTSKIWEFWA